MFYTTFALHHMPFSSPFSQISFHALTSKLVSVFCVSVFVAWSDEFAYKWIRAPSERSAHRLCSRSKCSGEDKTAFSLPFHLCCLFFFIPLWPLSDSTVRVIAFVHTIRVHIKRRFCSWSTLEHQNCLLFICIQNERTAPFVFLHSFFPPTPPACPKISSQIT